MTHDDYERWSHDTARAQADDAQDEAMDAEFAEEREMKCEHDGCTSTEVSEWTIQGYDPEPVFYYCNDHAKDAGFCWCCGAFVGGTEDFMRTEGTDLCFDCFLDDQREEEREMDLADYRADLRETWDDEDAQWEDEINL